MRNRDFEIRAIIENILENNSSGIHLKKYFDSLPDNKIRRTISILSRIYPIKKIISDSDFSFIIYMFSDIRFVGQESFFAFVESVNILSLTEYQKKLLRDAIKNNIEILCKKCTFELDSLLISLFVTNELFQYLEYLADNMSFPVLQHILDILQYEDFSKSGISNEEIESLKQKIYKHNDKEIA